MKTGGKNNKPLYSHDYYVAQLLWKVLYAVKNLRRRWTLGLSTSLETITPIKVRKYFKKKGVTAKTATTMIKNFYLNPWVDARVLERKEKNSYRITPFGRRISRIISELKGLDLLPIPIRQRLYPELILLELRGGKKTYQELKSELNTSVRYAIVYRVTKRLKDTNLIKISHPCDSVRVPHLFRFSLAPYYYFIEGIKNCLKETDRSEFSVYWIITHLNRKWQDVFHRSINLDEARQLLEKGVETGGIIKTDGSYKASIKDLIAPIKDLTPSERRVLNLLKEGYTYSLEMSEKIGVHLTYIHKILKRLEKRNLVTKEIGSVTAELTGDGRHLADGLFKIKECVIQEVGQV